jgi:hypothetical protein
LVAAWGPAVFLKSCKALSRGGLPHSRAKGIMLFALFYEWVSPLPKAIT